MVGLVESKQALAGEEVVSCDSPAGRLGVAICYDMRFPELSQKLTFLHGAQVHGPSNSYPHVGSLPEPHPCRTSTSPNLIPAEPHPCRTSLRPAQVLTFPSAFAMKTGAAHWETLLRARAIECQTYVVASAQAGLHNTDGNQRRSWGHSLAVDPWGAVVASFGAEDTVRSPCGTRADLGC